MYHLIIALGMFSVAAACSPQSDEAEIKLRLLQSDISSIKTGSEFATIAERHGLECHRSNSVSEYSYENDFGADTPETPPDQTLNCLWVESTSDDWFAITFGAVQATVYLASDQIIAQRVETIYTGP